MRITGGTLLGRRVRVPPGVIRPAMDRMRESLFSILGPLDGFSFLDLFCGSGIMTLEAISRGATRATLVERDHAKRAVIVENLELAKDTACPSPRLFVSPVESFVAREKATYDIVYLDPPFAYRHKADLLGRIARAGLLDEDGVLLIHYPREDDLPSEIGSLAMSDERHYGRSTVRFFRG
ncbi:MAG: 16S rRNA (guanine(966)-N(2))-methyltransferase RsmD [Spirochaetota bacterium]